jgi:HrpA-like RNA helicase
MPPTLKVKGKLKATGYGLSQEELDGYIPIDYISDFIKKRYSDTSIQSPLSRLFLILATPGSGKTTTMVGDLFYAMYSTTKRGLVCTQPRVNTCIDKAKEMIEFYTSRQLRAQGMIGDPLEYGVNIGYNTGKDKLLIHNAGITYMTSGVLVGQMVGNGDSFIMNKYGVIIIDEAHDKTIPTVNLIDAIKKFLMRNYLNPACPVIILTTGTFNPFLYADYMLASVSLPERYFNIISVEGSSHPIDHKFITYNSTDILGTVKKLVYDIQIDYPDDYVDKETAKSQQFAKLIESAKKVRDKIVDGGHDRKTYSSILVFDSGVFQRHLESELNYMKDPLTKEYPIKPILISRQNAHAGDRSFEEAFNIDVEDLYKGDKRISRKVVVSTNVIETGATVKRLGYCIDTGWCQRQNFNPNFNVHMLLMQPVTKDMHIQRIGRVGRTAPGVGFAAFSKQTFDSMPEYTIPEIVISDCADTILSMIIREADYEYKFPITKMSELKNILFKGIDILNIDSLDKPPIDMLQYQCEKLFTLGCITIESEVTNSLGYKINLFKPTEYGLVASKLMSQINGFSLECCILLLSASSLGLCMYDAILIASVASLGSFDYKSVKDIVPTVLMPVPDKQILFDIVGDTVIMTSLIIRHIINCDIGIKDICVEIGCKYENYTNTKDTRRNNICIV